MRQVTVKARVIEPDEIIYPHMRIQDTDASIGEGCGELIIAYSGKRIGILFGDLLNAGIEAIVNGDANAKTEGENV
jgi:hypothetical protein